jgi:arsenate reductase
MAEALLNYRGGTRFEAFSAGSSPAGFVHPLTIQTLRDLHIPLGKLVSKSWTEFKDQPFDAVITLCAAARDDICPVWPPPSQGTLPVRAHWGFDDPIGAWVLGEEKEREEFRRVRDAIRRCIEHLATAPDSVIGDDAAFAALVRKIAEDAPNPEVLPDP